MDRDGLRIIIIEPGGNPNDPAHFILGDITEALLELGHKVETIDLKNPVSLGDMIDRFHKFNPHFLFTLDFVGIKPTFVSIFKKMKLPIVSWMIDKYLSFDFLKGVNSPNCYVFVTDREDIKGLTETGFSKVYFLPGGTNPRRFKEINLTSLDKEKYECDLSLVGTSWYSSIDYWERYLDSVGDFAREALEEMLRFHMPNLNNMHKLKIEDLYQLMNLIENRYGFSFVFKDNEHKNRILSRLHNAGIGYLRKEIVESLCDLGLYLFGDAGWQKFETTSSNYKGRIYCSELPKLYNASKINLAVAGGRIVFDYRIADMLACGGFVIAVYVDGIEEFLELDKEVVCFKNKEELREKIKYYLAHPKEREEIARRGQEWVLREHTYKKRMQEMIDILKGVING